MPEVYDLAIIGGGINGCGIARDAAGRGLSVVLCEMGDLASGTSSWSTKLIHGGLRYLEHYEFRLVREALMEREVLWQAAPHIIRSLRFVLPHQAGLRPAWMLRTGLFLYDNLGGRQRLAGTRTIDLASDDAGRALKPGLAHQAFEYSDCWVDDARLVVLNAQDAGHKGADIRTRTHVTSARRADGIWEVETADRASGRHDSLRAKILVNAAGPWVDRVLNSTRPAGANTLKPKTRLVQGSHIVVRRLFDHDRAYILQNHDKRIVFAIPYEDDFTLIGTTDRDYDGDPAAAKASPDEIQYLCEAVSACFAKPITPADVVWTYSGVRPLYDDGASAAQEATRDYVLELDAPPDGAPLLSIFGGKITTYRRLAEAALQRLSAHLPDAANAKAGWTHDAPLPGGDLGIDGQTGLPAALMRDWPFLSPAEAARLARTYGTKARDILAGVTHRAGLGVDFGAGLSEREVRYLQTREWAVTAEDILWRRTKLGAHLTTTQAAALTAWLATASPENDASVATA